MKVLILTSHKISKPPINAELSVKSWVDADNVNLIDYDGIIFDLEGLRDIRKEKDDFYLYNLEEQIALQLLIDVLGDEKSFIWFVGDPAVNIEQRDFLESLGLATNYNQKTGSNIADIKQDGKFYGYWSLIKEYEYYLGKTFSPIQYTDTYRKAKHIIPIERITTKSGYILGAKILMFNSNERPLYRGDLVITPLLERSFQASVDIILKIYFDEGLTTEPEWLQDIKVVGQQAIEDEISSLSGEIEELVLQKQNLEKDKQDLRKQLEVLYKSDKPLEESVKYLLGRIGFAIENPKEPNKVEFCTSYANKKFVVEVKSTKKETFSMGGLRQVMNWQMDKAAECEEKYKPLFIASNQYAKPLAERNKDILPPNLIKFAEQYEICVLPVTVLFFISQLIDEKKYTIEQFVDLLNKTIGIVEMPKV